MSKRLIGGPIYDADKMFDGIDELRETLLKATEKAVAEISDHLPFEPCWRCKGQAKQFTSIGDYALGIPLGEDCPRCLGTGVEMRVPYNMEANVWVRLVLRAWDVEYELPEPIRALVAALVDHIDAWDHQLVART